MFAAAILFPFVFSFGLIQSNSMVRFNIVVCLSFVMVPILSFIDEKKEWLKKWQEVMASKYKGSKHDINPKGLNLAKLA